MIKAKRQDDESVQLEMMGNAGDLMFESGSILCGLFKKINEYAGPDSASEFFWDLLKNVVLNLMDAGIDVTEYDPIEKDDDDVDDEDISDTSAFEQALLRALSNMKRKDDDEGTIDDLPMF